MSATRFTGINFSEKLQNLSDGLRLFGLNPRDWQIKESTEGILKIHHLRDPELTLHGAAYSKGHAWDWQEITLPAI